MSKTTYDLTNLNLSAGNYAITVVAEAEGFTDSDASNSVNYTVQAQLAAPTIAMNADGKTLEITDVANATSYDVYVDGTLKTNVARIVEKQFTLSSEPFGGLHGPNNVYIKLGSTAPTSANDYDYYAYGDDTNIYNNSGAIVGTKLTLNSDVIYLWGKDGVNIDGKYIDFSSSSSSHTTYDKAYKSTGHTTVILRPAYFSEPVP